MYEYIGIFKVHITILYALTRAERERCVAVEDADAHARGRGGPGETEITPKSEILRIKKKVKSDVECRNK